MEFTLLEFVEGGWGGGCGGEVEQFVAYNNIHLLVILCT